MDSGPSARSRVSTISSVANDRPNLAIVYNKPSAIFRNRDCIEGTLVVATPDTIHLNGITMKCSGEAKVSWETGSEYRRRRHTNNEKYFDILELIVGELPDGDGSAVSLPPGEHHFPFSFSIPTNIPSSFESHFGCVRYSCTAILKLVKYQVFCDNRPPNCIKIKTYEHKEAFIIKNMLDISTIPKAKDPMYFEGSKAVAALVCCWNMGYLVGKIKINQSAFIPKDKILVSVEVRNTTTEPLRIFEVSLRKIITYSDKSGKTITDPHNQVVCSAGSNETQPGTERCTISAAKQLRIPKNLPPTNLGGGCSIIHVSYHLKFSLSVSSIESANTSLRLNIPLHIGTEDSSVHRRAQHPVPVHVPEVPFPAFPPEYSPAAIDGPFEDDRPPMPPSYEEATASQDSLIVQ